MAKSRRQDPKSQALGCDGALNPHPEAVKDPLFTSNPFFDPKDLVQVRYEMVRRHQADGLPISDAAQAFGVSRPTFYKAQSALQTAGLAGLLPKLRGPKDGHKISAEVVAFVIDLKAGDPKISTPQCIAAIEARFGITVHRRSLERALARKKKTVAPSLGSVATNAAEVYESLRAAVLNAEPVAGPDLTTIRHRGLASWISGLTRQSIAEPAGPRPLPKAPITDPPPGTRELIRLLAGIVVTLVKDPAHA